MVDIYHEAREKAKEDNRIRYSYQEHMDSLSREISTRIRVAAKRYVRDIGFSIEYWEQKIRSDEALWYVSVLPSPSRQGFYEKAFYDFCAQQHDVFSTVVRLSDKPKRDVVLVGGDVVDRRNKSHIKGSSGDNLRSLDFYFETLSGVKIYSTNKFTESQGGSQNNQRDSAVKQILSEVDGSEDHFAIILDGNFYQKREPNGNTMIENLAQSHTYNNVFIGDYRDFISWAKRLPQKNMHVDNENTSPLES